MRKQTEILSEIIEIKRQSANEKKKERKREIETRRWNQWPETMSHVGAHIVSSVYSDRVRIERVGNFSLLQKQTH